MTTLGDLGSIFQLSAGVALALSVFRAPYEEQYRKLSAILDAEEATLKDRDTTEAVVAAAHRVGEIRGLLFIARKQLEPAIEQWLLVVRITVATSAVLLTLSSLYSSINVSPWIAMILISLSVCPLVYAYVKIQDAVRLNTSLVRREISQL